MDLWTYTYDLINNENWYTCIPKQYWDSGDNECKACHPSCEYSCAGSEECVNGVYDLMGESSWTCPLTGTASNPTDIEFCTDCLGHAVLEGLETNWNSG